MNARRIRFYFWVILLIALTVVLYSPNRVSAQDTSPANVDRYGDPLPTGAKLRLGTVRLRQEQGVNGVTFSPDGKQLVSTGWESSVRFWDVDSGRLVRRLESNEDDGGSFAAEFSSDGKKLATVGERGFVRLWNLQTGKVLWSQLGHVERDFGVRVYGVAFAPDGRLFATAGADQWIKVWDTESGKQTLALRSEEGGGDARPVAFSPDGKLLASGNSKGTIQIWDLGQGGKEKTIPKAHQRDVTSLIFIDDGRSLISSGNRFVRAPDGSRSVSEIHVWNAATGTKQAGFATDEELLGNCTLAISPDGRYLASGHYGKIAIWNLPDRTFERVIYGDLEHYGGRTHGLAISPDNRLVAGKISGSGGNKIYLWNLQTGEPVLPQDKSHTEAVLAIDVSPDGSLIATGSADDTVRLWDAKTGEHLRLLDEGFGWVRYVEFFPDGKRIALGRETFLHAIPKIQGEVKILSVEDGKTLHQIQTPDRVMCGAMSSSGDVVAVGIGLSGPFSEDAPSVFKILAWDTQSGTQIADHKGHISQIQCLRFGKDDHFIASTSEGGTLRKRNVVKEEETEEVALKGRQGRSFIYTALVPESMNVLVGSLEMIDDPNGDRESRGKLMLCDAQNGEPIWQLVFDDTWPRELAVSRDGRIAATALRRLSETDGRNRIVVLSIEDGKELQSFELPDGRVRSLAFAPDENQLLSGMEAGDTLLWDISAARHDQSRRH